MMKTLKFTLDQFRSFYFVHYKKKDLRMFLELPKLIQIVTVLCKSNILSKKFHETNQDVYHNIRLEKLSKAKFKQKFFF